MNTALAMTTALTTIEAETDAVVLMNTARELAETLNTSLETSEGNGRNEIAKGLAAILNAVAKRIEG